VTGQTERGLVAFYDIRSGNGAGLFLQPRSPLGARIALVVVSRALLLLVAQSITQVQVQVQVQASRYHVCVCDFCASWSSWQRRGELVACKVFRPGVSSREDVARQREFNVMTELKHENVVKFIAVEQEVRIHV